MHLNALRSRLTTMYGEPTRNGSTYIWQIERQPGLSINLHLTIQEQTRNSILAIFDPTASEPVQTHIDNLSDLDAALQFVEERLPM